VILGDLPPRGSPLKVLSDFALSFDGYAWAGGGPFEMSLRLDVVARTRPDWTLDTETDIDVIRAAMFWEQRNCRYHAQMDANPEQSWNDLAEYLGTGVERLRELMTRRA